MGRTWRARRYEPGDEGGILALRKLVFAGGEEQRNSEAYWRWQYMDAPAGPATIWLAVDDVQVVGHYAVRPERMQCDGEPLAGSVSLDAMTHPDHRREGVFATLGRESYKDVERAGLDVTYIWPRQVAMEGSVAKFNWEYMSMVPVMVKPLNLAAVAESLTHNRGLTWPARRLGGAAEGLLWRGAGNTADEQVSVRSIDRFEGRMDLFWQKASHRHRIATVRDSRYLNWRYLDNPGRRYEATVAEEGDEILSYVVIRYMEYAGLRGAMLVDLGALPGHERTLAALLARAELVSRQRQEDLLACLINGDRAYEGALRARGFHRVPARLGLKEWHFGCRLNSQTLDRKFFLEPANWFLTFGDTDVI